MTSYRRVRSRPMVGSPVTGQSVHMTAPAGRSPIEELLLRGGSLPDAARFGAATYFADHRAPRGDRHVRVCTGTGCFIGSRGDGLGLVESALGVGSGGLAADGSVSLQAVHCLGYCYAGPAALDGDAPRAGPDLVEQLDGRAAPTDPEVAVAAVSTPVVLRGIVSGEAPWQVWPSVVTSSEGGERVVGEVTRAGLRGRGGAGFPAAQKWVAVRQADDPGPRFVVANGDEGDPGSFADRLLMERDPGRVLEGLALAALACRATAGFVYVRSEYPRARASVERAVEAARSAGHLGVDIHGSGVDFDVEVVSGHGSYVAGEETSLLRSMAGLRGTVRVRPPYPTRHGYLGRPTAVNNVETLAAVPAILADGGAAYARLGRAPETGTLLVCLTERFARPGAYEVELGTPLRAIVEELGGGLKGGAELRALQVGGPLGGFLAPSQLDLPLLESALARGRSVARARQPGGDRQQCLSRRPARPRVAVRCRRELRRLYAVPRGHPPRGLRPGAHQRGRRPARPDGSGQSVRLRPPATRGGPQPDEGAAMELTVDGHPVEVPEGAHVLDATRTAGTDVPTLCHDDRVSPAGVCRACLVRADGEVVAACVTPAVAGMEVTTTDPEVTSQVSLVLGLMAERLPVRALDRHSELTALCERFGVGSEAFGGGRGLDRDESHPYFTLDRDLCISCGRCVRMCDEVQGTFALTLAGRGADTVVAPGHGGRVDRLGLCQLRRLRRLLPDRCARGAL